MWFIMGFRRNVEALQLPYRHFCRISLSQSVQSFRTSHDPTDKQVNNTMSGRVTRDKNGDGCVDVCETGVVRHDRDSMKSIKEGPRFELFQKHEFPIRKSKKQSVTKYTSEKEKKDIRTMQQRSRLT